MAIEKKTHNSATFVIFGVTGDLARRKIIPALFDLFRHNMLPKHFSVLGFSRRDWDDAAFRNFAALVLNKDKSARAKEKKGFLKHAYFSGGTFGDTAAYRALGKKLHEIDAKSPQCANTLFHLAVPPKYYETIVGRLSSASLVRARGDEKGWTRVLVEKPFGSNLQTAHHLDTVLGRLFKEEQIFRIDHYLAKETLQNILSFRFSNAIFENIWNARHIRQITIRLHERSGVAGRGEFYDEIGALRDVGQNHLLQMLALVTMDDPKELNDARIRKERARALAALKPITATALPKKVLRAQYEGYTDEHAVAGNSQTETFFRINAQMQNERWKGMPIILESGKKMANTKTEIIVHFKEKETCVCEIGDDVRLENVLRFNIQPNEGISIRFWAKKPGFTMEVEPRNLSFMYDTEKDIARVPDAYEYILYECIRGDQTLFASTEEVTASWKFIMSILRHWKKTPLHRYAQGKDGPHQ